MTTKTKPLWIMAIHDKFGRYEAKRWIFCSGKDKPVSKKKDPDSETQFEMAEEDARKFIKGMPKFIDGKIHKYRLKLEKVK